MPIRFTDYYNRSVLKGNPSEYFVFGDNFEEKGFGGQAKEARGEPNALGIRTKWKPTMDDDAFFDDNTMDCWAIIKADFQEIEALLSHGHTVWFPKAGVGTGLSELKTRAPAIHRYIHGEVVRLYNQYVNVVQVPEIDV